MSQVSSTVQAPAVPAFGGMRRLLSPIGMIAVLFSVAGILLAAIVASQIAGPAPVTSSRSGEVVDGWEAGFMARSLIIVAQGAQDGYLPALLAADRTSGDLVDGYLPGLLVANASAQRAVPIVDGWEGALLQATPRMIFQDGWEAGLY